MIDVLVRRDLTGKELKDYTKFTYKVGTSVKGGYNPYLSKPNPPTGTYHPFNIITEEIYD